MDLACIIMGVETWDGLGCTIDAAAAAATQADPKLAALFSDASYRGSARHFSPFLSFPFLHRRLVAM